MLRSRILFAAGSAFALALAAGTPTTTAAQTIAMSGAKAKAPATARRYGGSAKVGQGNARAYILTDKQTGEPVEIGIAFSERALDGLPTTGTGHHDGHVMPHTYLLDLPAGAAAPFQFIELNWNPMGHEPDGVYQDVPHFDFHFYTISKAERGAIVPSDPQYATKANNIPSGDYVPAHNVPLGPPGAAPAQLAVPMMGVHWSDMRSPELQKLVGNPDGYKPFTATFIHGSWDGKFIFWEPMITRAHMVAKKSATDPAVRDEIIPIPTPARYHVAGHYPSAYRITWDAQAKEYRVALTGLSKKQ